MEKIITLPETPYENIVYSIWKRILGHNEFGIDDDFFEAGGNSMKALEVISELNEKFEFDINDFFGTPNIRSIAKGLHENPEAMKARLKDVLEFRESKVKDINEWQKYEASYQAIVDIKKEIDAYQHILVLGATGFLGVYLLREILIQSKAKVTVLIRGKGIERLQHQYNNFFGEGAFEKEINRIQVVNGDLTKNYMGLSEEDFKKLSENIDAIVNSAALVKHMGKNAEFETVNINIVKNIIELAAIGRKKVIHHMSTLGITYGEQGESKKSLFTEYDETVHHELTNQYLHSKYEAEQILFKARNQGIESTIYRMNGILFDSMTGKYQENMAQSTNYVFYRNLYKLGIIQRG
ncbi:SDR family oxidoreductase [Cellulosilyticum ruminicola]|uniref:SDR family oxidoreductase n=1 Tax=Cellulosilyticum ruminicola TaxID=425254 RepID=UPI0006D27A7E|nr:SDR family oxidoreductase [Cellulosilyticum ruminicola]